MEEQVADHTIKYREMLKKIEKSGWVKEQLEEWKKLVAEEAKLKEKKLEVRQRILSFLLNETHPYTPLRNVSLKFPDLDLEIYFEKFRDMSEVLRTKLTIRKILVRRFGRKPVPLPTKVERFHGDQG